MNMDWKKIIIAAGATLGIVGGGLYLTIKGVPDFLPVRIPAELEQIATLKKDRPQDFEVLVKLYEIRKATPPGAKTETLGLPMVKITGTKTSVKVDRLVLDGYAIKIKRPNWMAVWITQKGINEMRAFEEFIKANPETSVAPTAVVATSTP